MLATYLTGERIALRALQHADKDHAVAWFEGEFPVNADRAEKYLRDELDELTYRKSLLVIVRLENQEVVGGIRVRLHPRHSEVHIHMAPAIDDADELEGEALQLVVAWLRDEGQHITVSVDVGADQHQTIAAADAIGMEQTARFREWYLRPGGRADRLVFQAIHPLWQGQETPDA